MNEFEINIANIQHVNKVTSNDGIIKGLIISLKYYFLKTSNIFLNFENLPSHLKKEASRLFENYEKENHLLGVSHIHRKPKEISTDERYFIVAEKKEILDFYKDVKISYTFDFFDWFFALIIVQTPIEKIGDLLDYNLTTAYKDDIAKMEYDLKSILLTFKSKYIQHNLEIFHRFNNSEINLFEIYNCNFKNTKKTIKNWLKYKKNNLENKKNTNKIAPPNFPIIKLNFSEELNKRIIDLIYENLNGNYFTIDKEKFEKHFFKSNAKVEYLHWQGQILEVKAFIDLMCVKPINGFKTVFNVDNNNILIEKHFLKPNGENFFAKKLNSTKSRKGYNKIFNQEIEHPITKLFDEIKNLINKSLQ